jgi:IMP dehydrogenase/GMP reductase
MNIETALEFDDVLIRPIPSTVSSRDDVDISVKLSDSLTLKFPLLVSPMIGIVNGAFAHSLSELGGLAIMHRFYESREDLFNDLAENVDSSDNFGISIGIEENGIGKYFDYNPKIILIDTANGYTERLLKYCEEIKGYIVKKNQDILLMAGNVVTLAGVNMLADAGCDLVRVGIGGGSPCSTRNQTGIGIPNISALQDCSITDRNVKLVIDGGIKAPGDFVKAIVGGADLGMAGLLYAQCYEAPHKGTIYGLASRTNMKNMNTEIKSVEGIDIPVEKKYSLEQFVREFGYGIKSGGTYLNARNLNEIYVNGKFVKVTDHAIKKGL